MAVFLAGCAGTTPIAAKASGPSQGSVTQAPSVSPAQSSAPVTSARAFFDRYVALSENYDPSLADLYAEDARVLAERTNEAGQIQTLTLTGKQWKRLLVQALPIAKQRGDRSRFSNVSVAEEQGGVRVTAQRYSILKCSLDDAYYMVISSAESSARRIVEEHSKTNTSSLCGLGEGKPLTQRLNEIAERLQAVLPVELDAETRLDKVTHDGKQLSYEYTLHVTDLDGDAFAKLMVPELTERTCAEAALSAVVAHGGGVVYAYTDDSGKPVTNVSVTSCKDTE